MDKKSGRTYVDSVIDWTMLATEITAAAMETRVELQVQRQERWQLTSS